LEPQQRMVSTHGLLALAPPQLKDGGYD